MSNGNEQKKAILGGEITCIKVTRETRSKLAGLGKKGQTYEHVINSLLESDCKKNMEETDVSP